MYGPQHGKRNAQLREAAKSADKAQRFTPLCFTHWRLYTAALIGSAVD